MNTLFTLTTDDLSKLSSEQAVIIFRDLLWCSARDHGIPVTKVHISGDITVKDGGIDASIDDQIESATDDLLIVAGTRFQIKAGTSFKPWQRNQVVKELFGKSTAEIKIENLNSGIKECLEESMRYVVVCFGVDPTPEQIKNAKSLLRDCFSKCGVENADIAVWGQSHLIGLLIKYPSLCMKILNKSDYVFQTLEVWSKNADMQTEVKLGDQQHLLISTIQDEVRSGHIHHIRLIGEPGIGKSRLALEALSADDLSPSVIYVRHSEDFQRSQLLNEIIRADKSLYVILVVDECPDKEKASIWNSLKSHSDKCTLITIDHGPDNSSDAQMKVHQCPLLLDEQIESIINSYLPEMYRHHASHWAMWCTGSPRVAHAVGENLVSNPDDILRSPATVQIWDRFVAGYEDVLSEQIQRHLIVLRHISLFYKFGFEKLVHVDIHKEAQFIAELVRQVDPSITWGQFASIIAELKERRILQGKNTLFIVPKALHVYLWLDFWKHHGVVVSIEELLQIVPDSLRKWFMQMFIYAHDNPTAQAVVKDILREGSIFEDREFLASNDGGQFLSVLAEADPQSTLRCLQRTFGRWSKEELLAWEDGRQDIVWTLEKIAVWEKHFVGATRVLLKIGAAENDDVYSNNSSGTFAELFSLGHGALATTEAPPSKRLSVLREALESDDEDEKLLGLKACRKALSTFHSRSIGVEYQGIKALPELWTPKVWGEIVDAYTDVWNLVFNVSRQWGLTSRQQANDVLISSARGVLARIPSIKFRELVLTTMDAFALDEASNKKNIVQLLNTIRRFDLKKYSEEEKAKLAHIDELIVGTTLESWVKRYVLYSSWDEDDYDDSLLGKPPVNRLAELALELANDDQAFDNVIDDLIKADGHNSHLFGSLLAHADHENKLLVKIIERQKEAGPNGDFRILSSYLAGLRELDETRWEKKVSEILNDDTLQEWIHNVIWIGGINDGVLEEMINLYKKNTISSHSFIILSYLSKTTDVSSKSIERVLLSLSNDESPEAANICIEVLQEHYCRNENPIDFQKELVYKIVTNKSLFINGPNSMPDYDWKEISIKFLSDYPEYALKLFEYIFSRIGDLIILKTHNSFHDVLQLIAKNKPSETWDIVKSKILTKDGYRNFRVVSWLEEEDQSLGDHENPVRPLTYFQKDDVFSWIDENPEIRAVAIVRAMPKTLDQSQDGRFTRDFVDNYGSSERVQEVLNASFFTESMKGPASIHHRNRRDEAREWLKGESSNNVIDWIESYIEELATRIEWEETQEERRY
ncbi:MAG: hypothetical protein AAF702_01485 [Chloroflexota bacterium]